MDSNVRAGSTPASGTKGRLNKTAFFYAIFKIFKQFSNNASLKNDYFQSV